MTNSPKSPKARLTASPVSEPLRGYKQKTALAAQAGRKGGFLILAPSLEKV
jgi:hypothetical protein